MKLNQNNNILEIFVSPEELSSYGIESIKPHRKQILLDYELGIESFKLLEDLLKVVLRGKGANKRNIDLCLFYLLGDIRYSLDESVNILNKIYDDYIIVSNPILNSKVLYKLEYNSKLVVDSLSNNSNFRGLMESLLPVRYCDILDIVEFNLDERLQIIKSLIDKSIGN